MTTRSTLRTERADGVFSIVLTRAEEYNTITPQLRDDLRDAIDEADEDADTRVILVAADGPAFCAGYGLDWAVAHQEQEEPSERTWDSVTDMRLMSSFVDVYLKLWYAWKPTIVAVQGWCIAGGTDMVLCADIIVAGESAVFGYPPARAWGVPTTPMWVYRMGLERAKRYLLTGDEIPAPEAARIGLILEAVPDDTLREHALELAGRIARLPSAHTAGHAQTTVQPGGGEHGDRVNAHPWDALRRHRTPHARGSRVRPAGRGGWLPPGRARARRPVRGLWLSPSVRSLRDLKQMRSTT